MYSKKNNSSPLFFIALIIVGFIIVTNYHNPGQLVATIIGSIVVPILLAIPAILLGEIILVNNGYKLGIGNNFDDVYERQYLNVFDDFSGKTTRLTFWTVTFINLTFYAAVFALDYYSWGIDYVLDEGVVTYTSVVEIILLIPSLAIGSRRLNDMGRSGFWQLLILTGVGILLLLYWWAQPSVDNDKIIKNETSNLSDELSKLNQLKNEEAITEEEFKKAKEKLLR